MFSGFPFVAQHDSMQCGLACLAMICRHYGHYQSLSGLAHLCHATKEGVSMQAISEAAENLGFMVRAGKIASSDLRRSPLPAILHWNQNHFVVLYKVTRNGKYHVADPGKGLVKYTAEEFLSHWATSRPDGSHEGIAMFLQPTDRFSATSRTENGSESRSLRFLAGYVSQYRKYFFHIIAGMALGCIMQLIMPFLTQGIVDLGIKHNDIGLIWLILLGEVMIITGSTVTDFIRRWLLLHISMRINISLVSDFLIKLLNLPMAYFDTKLIGDIMQRIGDHERVESFLTSQLLSILFTMISFAVFGIVLLIYDRMIFFIFLSGSLLYALWMGAFLKRRKILDYEIFECEAINRDKTYRFLSAIQEVKLQDCERRRRWEWEDIQADLFTIRMKSLKLQQTQEAGSIFINELKNVIITVLAATAVINGQMTLGGMLAIQYIIGQLNSPVEQLMGFIYSIQDVKISLERINEIHNERNESDTTGNRKIFSGKKNITLENVNFKYDPHSKKQILEEVSVNVAEGRLTAIVGASGSGKTTLVKLMLGYYRVNGGTLTIAGRDINDYDMKWWRRQCGVVMQDGVIFSESIKRNIAVDDGEVDMERLMESARIANIHDYIESLPLQYETVIGADGIGLSQGQKQRILIARAVYKNPDFIFLDEATNALDAKNEREIVDNLSRFYKGRTVVVVAHRLSTVKNADTIIVLDQGKVVETGNHLSLTDKKGIYYNLVKNQLELGK
ncbi:MAG: peptidase domain-containing ABC transporter [Muribaculum sp.]|nr:peptidase domain-containing ABC transporter [Muribaculum sp.]